MSEVEETIRDALETLWPDRLQIAQKPAWDARLPQRPNDRLRVRRPVSGGGEHQGQALRTSPIAVISPPAARNRRRRGRPQGSGTAHALEPPARRIRPPAAARLPLLRRQARVRLQPVARRPAEPCLRRRLNGKPVLPVPHHVLPRLAIVHTPARHRRSSPLGKTLMSMSHGGAGAHTLARASTPGYRIHHITPGNILNGAIHNSINSGAFSRDCMESSCTTWGSYCLVHTSTNL